MKKNAIIVGLIILLSVTLLACKEAVPKADSFDIELTSNAIHGASGQVVSNIRVNGEADGCHSISTCRANLRAGSVLILTAIPDAGSHFVSWAGDCTGSDPICNITMDADKQVKALFDKKTEVKHILTVKKIGSGTGKVKDGFVESFIDCGVHCDKDILEGTTVILTASADLGSEFVGWTGDCSGLGNCIVTMDSAKNVFAKFDKKALTKHNLEVKIVGFGAVKSLPEGIECPTDCNQEYSEGSSVTLTASPDDGFRFIGWDNACSGTSETCTLTMTESKLAIARFEVVRKLSVTKDGSGSGVVTSFAPADEINCGTAAGCTANYPNGTVVKLKATAADGSRFVGWSGDCSGVDTCIVTMNANKNVTARFSACVDPVVIPDLFLRIAIKGQLGISGSISCANLESLTKLDSHNNANTLNSKKIANLEGLQYAVNLETLILSYNKITNISPIASLKKLQSLYLDHNRFSNIDALKVLPNLDKLALNNNYIATIVALVDNAGLSGASDNVALEQNCLNIDPFASGNDKSDINKLIARHVNVSYSPQRHPKTCP